MSTQRTGRTTQSAAGRKARRRGEGVTRSTTSLPLTPAQIPVPIFPGEPFTLPHFLAWASDLILDTGEPWVLEPFQEAFVTDVFSGIAECWLIVPESNAKTTLIAGLALYFAEHRPHASIPIAAASKEQASIAFDQAMGFVLRSPRMYERVYSELQAAKGKQKLEVPRFVVLEGVKKILHYAGAKIQVFAAEDRTGDGVLPDLAVLDELHRHRDLALYRTWSGKLGKRAGQLVAISTAGEPGAEFEDTREAIRAAATSIHRDGAFGRYATDSVVLHEWALADGADADDIEAVKAANPLRAITVESLAAKHDRPTMTPQHWSRFVCNRPTRAVEVAIQESEWLAAAVTEGIPPGVPLDALGADFGWKWDTSAFVPYWIRSPDHRVLGPASVIVPPRDGSSTHPDTIKTALLTIHHRNPIRVMVLDPSDALDIAAWVRDELGIPTIEVTQTSTNHVRAAAAFMEGLRNGWLKHTNDPELTRHVLNAVTRILPGGDARFERPSQSRRSVALQERRVIDALTAASFAVAFAAPPEPPKRTPLFAVGSGDGSPVFVGGRFDD